ncbi:hypothetical protein KVT40_004352 [Elsinoe batatas]|uniref:Uncharacterized protein n=1 Tax=Elsinoe batatas TaxID=2601811 RepID=A0A8K0L4S9_9PEZI|nr:hypothetical protein KVT40_004352 [Elsinoe batatas]
MALNTTGSDGGFVQFVNPATQTPLFTAEWVTCAYPASDIYGSSPRYLYYALLVAVFFTQWYPWLANVFLGVAATYAGTAAIEAMILIGYNRAEAVSQTVTIPLINSTVAAADSVLSTISNLITDRDTIDITPDALDFDIDAVLAITVTAYLTMLPVHCWSSFVQHNRARRLLVLLWNLLMLAGALCALILWPTLLDTPLQYRFCYPSILDSTSVTSDGNVNSSRTSIQSWNNTIWNTFSNYNNAADLNTNCLYPCFTTEEVLRRPNMLVANTQTYHSPRTKSALALAGIADPSPGLIKEYYLTELMIAAIVVTGFTMIVMLLFLLTGASRLSRVPLHRPKEMFHRAKTPFPAIWEDIKRGGRRMMMAVRSPRKAWRDFTSQPEKTRRTKAWHLLRFGLDVLALTILLIAMVLTPAVIVAFVVFIEWYIHLGFGNGESPREVGQWATSVGVGLVLVSALVLRLRHVIASRGEVEGEIRETEEKLRRLRELLETKNGNQKGDENEEEGRGEVEMGRLIP